MSDFFGDDDGNAWDASGALIDPSAVAVRLHDSRWLDGGASGPWWTLDLADRSVAVSLAVLIVARLREGQGAGDLAQFLRDLREYMTGEPVPEDVFLRDVRILDDLVASINREGTR
jgi:hypothetical protein